MDDESGARDSDVPRIRDCTQLRAMTKTNPQYQSAETRSIESTTKTRTEQQPEHILQLMAEAILESGPFQEINAQIQVLLDKIARLERLERRIGEIECRLWSVEDLRQGVHQVVKNVRDLENWAKEIDRCQRQQAERIAELEDELDAERERVAGLEDSLAAVQGLFADRVIEGERAHESARNRDPRQVVELGETCELFVQEVNLEGPRPQAIGRIENLVIFVTLDHSRVDVEEGDVITLEITDHGESCAMARLPEGVNEDE